MSNSPRWMTAVLWAAAVYNLVWGAWVVLFPNALFDLLSVPRLEPAGTAIWQCVGMIVGVYGVGYAAAARDPARHWPIVLVGLLGKVFGPIGFVDAVLVKGLFPASFGWTILTNDLIWWIPFTLMLVHAYRVHSGGGGGSQAVRSDATVEAALAEHKTDGGRSLLELSRAGPVLVVCLRHFGCTFCREALADLAKARPALEGGGAKLVLVHMATPEYAADYLPRYGLGGVAHVSDQGKRLYAALGLKRGSLGQLFGWKSMTRGFRAGVIDGHLVGRLIGDGFQMPGVFLIRDGRVRAAFVHESAADRPDYCELARA